MPCFTADKMQVSNSVAYDTDRPHSIRAKTRLAALEESPPAQAGSASTRTSGTQRGSG
jgi:hypothetical protein